MQIFLDTAEIREIAPRADQIDGITTNPSLIARSGASMSERIGEIARTVPGPVSAEVIATDLEGMLDEGRRLHAIADNVIIKLPLTMAGLQAARVFGKEDIPTNVTLCFSLSQALMAARAGATFVSPFVGRVEDAGGDGIGLLKAIRDVYDQFGFETAILAASLRNQAHVEAAALAGCDAATVPVKIFDRMIRHSQTDSGLDAFMADWAAARLDRSV